jgi:hypothetical protein
VEVGRRKVEGGRRKEGEYGTEEGSRERESRPTFGLDEGKVVNIYQLIRNHFGRRKIKFRGTKSSQLQLRQLRAFRVGSETFVVDISELLEK